MVLLSRIYTKSGDKGRTSLGNNTRVSKSHPRIELIGAVDEANAALGVCRLHARDNADIDGILAHIQNDLFDVGADVCVPEPENDTPPEYPPLRVSADQVTYLETTIDLLNAELAPLRSFVLPGGSALASYIHVARTIVRRAERIAVALREAEPLSQHVVNYLNRLSDLLFVMTRFVNARGDGDVLWVPGEHR